MDLAAGRRAPRRIADPDGGLRRHRTSGHRPTGPARALPVARAPQRHGRRAPRWRIARLDLRPGRALPPAGPCHVTGAGGLRHGPHLADRVRCLVDPAAATARRHRAGAQPRPRARRACGRPPVAGVRPDRFRVRPLRPARPAPRGDGRRPQLHPHDHGRGLCSSCHAHGAGVRYRRILDADRWRPRDRGLHRHRHDGRAAGPRRPGRLGILRGIHGGRRRVAPHRCPGQRRSLDRAPEQAGPRSSDRGEPPEKAAASAPRHHLHDTHPLPLAPGGTDARTPRHRRRSGRPHRHPALGTDARRARRAGPRRHRHLRGQHGHAHHRPRAGAGEQRPAVGGHGIPPDVRRLPPPRRSHLRPGPTPCRLPHRADAVHHRLAAHRVRQRRSGAHRRPCRPGSRRRPDDAGSAVDHQHHLHRQAEGPWPRTLGSHRRPGHRPRRRSGRRPHHVGELGGDLLDQRADRHARHRHRPSTSLPRTPRVRRAWPSSTCPEPSSASDRLPA